MSVNPYRFNRSGFASVDIEPSSLDILRVLGVEADGKPSVLTMLEKVSSVLLGALDLTIGWAERVDIGIGVRVSWRRPGTFMDGCCILRFLSGSCACSLVMNTTMSIVIVLY